MPLYSYTVREKDGKIKRGVKEGQNQTEVLASLQGSGLLVTQLIEVLGTTAEVSKPKKKTKLKLHKRVRLGDMILMARQLATLVGAGITLLRSIEMVLQQIESKNLRKAIEEIQEDIRSGKTFNSALARHPKIFSDFWINLIRMGEAGGHLPQTLDQLATFLEGQGLLQSKVISAMVYPMVLVGVSALVIVGFLVKIVPIFSQLFSSFGVELPPLTRIVIGASELFRRQILSVVLVGGAIFFLARSFLRTERGKRRWDRIKLSLPLLGEIFRKTAIANFARGLGTLIKSGVPILYSLEIIGKSSGNKVVEEILENVRKEVREGRPIADPLGEGDVFDSVVVQMVRIGEEIGELGNMLEKVGKFYESQVETLTTRLVTLIEPAAILVMGVIVGILVVSMYLPIFSISQLAEKSM